MLIDDNGDLIIVVDEDGLPATPDTVADGTAIVYNTTKGGAPLRAVTGEGRALSVGLLDTYSENAVLVAGDAVGKVKSSGASVVSGVLSAPEVSSDVFNASGATPKVQVPAVVGAAGTDFALTGGACSGSGTVSAGDVSITAGAGSGALHSGGALNLAGGAGTVNGGDVTIAAGVGGTMNGSVTLASTGATVSADPTTGATLDTGDASMGVLSDSAFITSSNEINITAATTSVLFMTSGEVGVKVASEQKLSVTSAGVQTVGARRRGGDIAPAALNVGVNADWNPADLATTPVIYVTANAGGSQLDSLAAQADGTEITLYASGGVLTIGHEATGAAANKFTCPGGANKVLANPDVVRIRYRGGAVNRWLVG